MCRINEFLGYSRDATLLTEAVQKYSHVEKYLYTVELQWLEHLQDYEN